MSQTEIPLPLAHNPARPARDLLGEQVFLEAWQRFMATPIPFYLQDAESRLEDVLSHYPGKVGQREATVCASLVTWLGTHCGNAFLLSCETLAKKHAFPVREEAYLAAWAVENKRRTGINSGVRALEGIMATELVPGHFGLRPVRAALSADDYECAECIVAWLASGDGQKLLEYCEREIKRRQETTAFPFREHEADDELAMTGETH